MLYRHPYLYHVVMRLLYGRYFHARYQMLDAMIEADATVVDLCAGDAYLYRHFLQARGVQYLALDNAVAMVNFAQKRGVNARVFDVHQDEIPSADIVLMQASLYHFIPHERAIITRMQQAARRCVIIIEPIRNWSDADNRVLSFLGKTLTTPTEAAHYQAQRFNQTSLRAAVETLPGFESARVLPGGREMMVVLHP